MSLIQKAVQFANYHYYSKPLSVLNYKSLQVPYPLTLKKVHTKAAHEFHLRISHGPLHALAAMELIERIDFFYNQYVSSYATAIEAISKLYTLQKQELLELIKVAVFFHDAAREGDGYDLWDPQSAEACCAFLVNQVEIPLELAELISDTIKYKDESEKFIAKHGEQKDFLRQLVNMCDTLEVIRTRDKFKPEYLPIAQHKTVTAQIMVENIIPGLVVPHREKIISEGRLSRAGNIEYKKDGFAFDDRSYKSKPGYNFAQIAETYQEKSALYGLAVLEINAGNFDNVLALAVRGMDSYIKEYNSNAKTGIQWFHDGFFSPRYHGTTGRKRAQFYKDIFEDNQPENEKALALYALLTNKAGCTLKEYILKSFSQFNTDKLLEQLENHLINNYGYSKESIINNMEKWRFNENAPDYIPYQSHP
ncbi:hypothetical protein ACFORL_11755 [Legionella dresdenensis]|uniref:HD/PDEase domain-containing protein n=1 Tax=Legionella dresdenensis TaxID=450200 RepID=A0ABV8CHE2_9GAMM